MFCFRRCLGFLWTATLFSSAIGFLCLQPPRSESLSRRAIGASASPDRLTPKRVLLFGVTDENNDSREGPSIQQQLVQLGLAWEQTPLSVFEEHEIARVSGCVATVYILASVDEDDHNGRPLQIQGNSDAIVSRGLLALLTQHIRIHLESSVDKVLALDPITIAKDLGVQQASTQGRNDGVAQMLRVIQQQLRRNYQASDKMTANTIEEMTKPTVALLLSGGVDSSVALRLLQQDGYDVTAFYLKIWLEDELSHLGECPWEDDVGVCQQVCDQAGVPLKILSLQKEYHQKVMQHTLQEASQGRTPNPDILCNSRVKFGCFLDSIDEKKYDYVASGHYAQLIRSHDNDEEETHMPVKLVRAPDPVKDQSYFLCALNQSQLQRLLFPIGHLQKTQVRELADHFELPNRKRPDSQGLCFLGKIKFRDFLEIHLGTNEGDIVDAFSGEVIGHHHGNWYHTVGQRKGIGPFLFPVVTSRGPWYVVAKDPARNIVYASNQYDEEVFSQTRREFHVENLHWIAGRAPLLSHKEGSHRFWLKIRHGPRLVQGTLQISSEKEDEGVITLDSKDGGLAAGQYAVFYTDDAECLGGGIISERHWAKFLLDTENRSETTNITHAAIT